MPPNQHCGKDVLQVMNHPRTEMLTPDLLKYVSTSTALVPVVCGDCDLEVQVLSHQCNDEVSYPSCGQILVLNIFSK